MASAIAPALPGALRTASGASTSSLSQQVSAKPRAVSVRAAPLRCRAEARQEASSSTDPLKWVGTTVVTLSAAAAILCGSVDPSFADAEYKTYFGTAASASSYGGYGGNTSKRDTAEYVYDVPLGWKERLISKIEKGTKGTDSEFFNPKARGEKVFLAFLPGFRRLPPQDNVLNDLALSDVTLQDLIASAESIDEARYRDEESRQLYYTFEIDSPIAHSLITVTCTKNKLYSHFVNAPEAAWRRDEPVLRHIHESFKTVGRDPLAPPDIF